MRTCELGYVAISMFVQNFTIWELHALFSEGVHKPLIGVNAKREAFRDACRTVLPLGHRISFGRGRGV